MSVGISMKPAVNMNKQPSESNNIQGLKLAKLMCGVIAHMQKKGLKSLISKIKTLKFIDAF